MAQETWQIGNVKFKSEAEYQDGLKDLALIRLIRKENDINDPAVAKALYKKLRFQEGLFKTEVGKKFFSELAHNAAKAELEQLDGEREKRLEQQRAQNLREQNLSRIESEYEKEEPKQRGSQRKVWLLVFVVLSILVLLFCVGRIVAYSLMGYESTQDINQLRTMIGESSITIEIDENAAEFAYTVSHQEALKNKGGVTDKYSELYEMNNDLIGWISIEDTQIDYPVMHNLESVEYYLHRGFDREESDEGLPFLDIRCTINPDSTNLLIYGHNMKNGHMFADLMKYESESFFKEHRIIRFDTIYEEGLYDIVAVFRTHIAYVGEDTFRYYGLVEADTVQDFEAYIENIKELSIYDTGVTAQYGDTLLTLSTCEYTEEDGRFVVVAKKIS